MRLYKDGGFVEDPWRALGDGEAIGEGPVLLSLAQWRQLAEARATTNARLGVLLEAGEMVDAILPDLDRLSLVALSFPKFGDGRAFSKAAMLRGQHGFRGEIRAVGDVLWDQLQLMSRCGFDAFAIENGPTLRMLEEGRRPVMTDFYQPGLGRETAVDPRRPWLRRLATKTSTAPAT